jgi:predicted ATP-dependent serine protease
VPTPERCPGKSQKKEVSKRRNTMNEESKKIEQKAEKTEQEKANAADLSEQELDNVAGGGASPINTSRSNIRNN